MEHIVDLHVHSRYAYATSKDSTLEGLYTWGKMKGISVIGTGDALHPLWLEELRAKLVLQPNGLYTLRRDIAAELDKTLPDSVQAQSLFFVPTVEIATIYRKHQQARKIHQLVIMPTIEAMQILAQRLSNIGNLTADGRPILGMDAKDVLWHSLDVSADSLYIPAHIWTPWFGVFGSKSGFNSLAEAYDELAVEIKAIETGLSSDPYMNWQVPDLQKLAITSHSDAHSPQKLGREATVIVGETSYDAIIGAIKTNDHRLAGTIEFYPEEGKYHSDGHRVCGVRFSPAETEAAHGLCVVCPKPVVVGVANRIQALSGQQDYVGTKSVEYIVPLPELLAELHGVKTLQSKTVQQAYHEAIAALGNEFAVLREAPLARIEGFSPALAHAVSRVRDGNVLREPGFDGVYGTIKIFTSDEHRRAMLAALPSVS